MSLSSGGKKRQEPFTRHIDELLYSDHIALKVSRLLLVLVAVGGLALVGAAAPGLLMLLKKLPGQSSGTGKKAPNLSRKKVNDSLVYLQKKKLINIQRYGNGKIEIRLTEGGKARIREYSLEALTIQRPPQWDRKWRVVMFDIPVHPRRYNAAREALRRKIKELGFYQVQKSAWVHPFECREEILFVAEFFGVQRFIEILVVEKFLYTDLLFQKFPFLRDSKHGRIV